MIKKWFLAIIILFPSSAHAEIPSHIAARVIIGEAADQGLKGMVCVAEVLRRRGSIKGFYGYRSNHVDSQPEPIWTMAQKAWELSKYTDYTKGADHFDNVRRFGRPWWAKACIKTYEYKDHVFYREIKHPRLENPQF